MANTYTLISSNTLSASAASVTFSSIPSTYTDLVLKVSARNDAAQVSEAIYFQLNSDTGTNYSSTSFLVNGTSPLSNRTTSDTQFPLRSAGAGATSNTFNSFEIYIPSYTVSQNKQISLYSVVESNGTDSYIRALANLWRNTATINNIYLFNPAGTNFVSGSSFYLYGIKNS